MEQIIAALLHNLLNDTLSAILDIPEEILVKVIETHKEHTCDDPICNMKCRADLEGYEALLECRRRIANAAGRYQEEEKLQDMMGD
jgi:hypothetical protein